MREPTPVTNSTIVIDSGSTRRLKRTSKPPALIHSTPFSTIWRSCSSNDSSLSQVATAEANDPAIINVAIQPETGSFRWRRPRKRMTNPASGKAGISQARSREWWAASCIGRSLPPQEADVVGGRALSPPEDRHDQRQADHHFGGGHHPGEEHEDLPADVVEHPGEGHERQVDGVEHQLHAHEHDQ